MGGMKRSFSLRRLWIAGVLWRSTSRARRGEQGARTIIDSEELREKIRGLVVVADKGKGGVCSGRWFSE